MKLESPLHYVILVSFEFIRKVTSIQFQSYNWCSS